MLHAIKFNDDRFAINNNLMNRMTKNTIIICQDKSIKDILYKEIRDICNGKHQQEGHEYCSSEKYLPKITNRLIYYPTVVLEICNRQKITISIEAPFIYKAKRRMDIWFAQYDINDKIELIALTDYKGHKDIWREGLDRVYEMVVKGRYINYSFQGYNKLKP